MESTMKMKNFFGFLVATLALAVLLVVPASAFVSIQEVVINGVEIDTPGSPTVEDISVTAGDTLDVRVTFLALESDEEVRVTARIIGEPGSAEDTSEFAVIEGKIYSKLLNVQLPFDLDDELDEEIALEITIEGSESHDTEDVEQVVTLHIQRENDVLQILAVDAEEQVKAGEQLSVDFVIKNRGRHKATDTFVTVAVPALGISRMVYLGDLYAQDHELSSGDNEEDTLAGRLFLKIPRDAPAGVYNIEVEASNDDSTVLATRKVVIVGGGADSSVVSSTTTKTFAVGQEQTYTVTIVNADNRIKVYELILETADGLTVELDDSVVAVPAGTSRTVTLRAMASREGTYDFAVNIHSDGELVKKQNFVAQVEGRSVAGGSTAVVLTIILAIIFVVLLIVLIVLLTRRPEKKEEFGESYY